MSTAGNSSQVERLETQLRAVVGQSGSLQPVDGLRRRGVQQIRVLSQSQLARTIQVAINRTLRKELDGIDIAVPALRTIEERAYREFERLVEAGVESEPPVHAPEAGFDPGLLREAMSRGQRPLASEGMATAEPATLRATEFDLESLERRMSQQISTLLANDLRKELAAVESSQRQQVELLESRIAKLARALESTDEILARFQDLGPSAVTPIGAGLAAPAAGLDPTSPLFEHKSQLLDALFQANLALRELRGDEVAND